MKTIFIITTRTYPPTSNTQFQPVIENYITNEEWENNFKEYRTVSSQYPVKKGVVGNVEFYVAPCMSENHTDGDFNYIRNLIKKVHEYTSTNDPESEFQSFLIAHDGDYNSSIVFAYGCNEESQYDSEIPNFDTHLIGYLSYKHENGKNLCVTRGDNSTSTSNDIYGNFIQFLNTRISVENVKNLKNILIELQLPVDFDIEENETDLDDIQNELNVSCSSLSYEIAEFKSIEGITNEDERKKINKENYKLYRDRKNYIHSSKQILANLPCPLKYLNERDKNFFDSSIWFYAYHNDEELQWIKEQIHTNSERYKLKKAREYKEFYSRMWEEDYFHTDYSSHAKYVIPFLFHSEQELCRKIGEKKKDIALLNQCKWRILLVDDHCTEKMAVVEGDATLRKLDIVKTELEKLFKNIATEKDNKTVIIATEEDTEDIKKNATIYIECASSIKEAKDKLAEKKYEIVLLDYLLGKKVIDGKTVTINNKEVREYGYELLKGIWYKENEMNFEENRKKELKKLYEEFVFDYKKGPDNRLYFMFISAFTTAISERLLTEGWHRSEDYWYIGEGACPINTPYLFQYRLLHIMEKRMKDMGLSKILGINSNDFEKSYIKEKIIDVIYDDRTSIRQNANNRFNEVLSVLYNYKNLLVDTHNASNPFDSPESTLATDIVMKNAYIGGFLEHLTQLVYLTAFGTVRQWPEMWEEYQFLKSVVGKRIESIEKYIFNLKNNSVD